MSDLERWRWGPPPRGSGPVIVKALDQVSEIMGLQLADLGAETLVPARRLGELAKYGMSADASLIRRHAPGRRLATLLATVRHLEAKSVDNPLELLDLLMSAELLNKAHRASDKEKVRKHPRLAKASARLAVAVSALFESDEWAGANDEPPRGVEGLGSNRGGDLAGRAARGFERGVEDAPPVNGGDLDDWRAELMSRYATVSGFLKLLAPVIDFGANAEGAPVLRAMQAMPDVLAYRGRLPARLIPARLIDTDVVNGPWRHLASGAPARQDGAVSRHAYAFCVLEQFWRHLKRREIYAEASTKWRNPQAQLLEGDRWEATRPDVLTTLGLPGDPDGLLAEHARTLDTAYREVGGRLIVNSEVRVDASVSTAKTGAYLK